MRILFLLIFGLMNIRNIDSVKEHIRTIEDVEQIMGYMEYKSDVCDEDEWLSPEKVLARGYNDCDGLGLLAYDLLTHINVGARLIRLRHKDYTHIICSFSSPFGNGFFSNTERFKSSYMMQYMTDGEYYDWSFVDLDCCTNRRNK